MGFWWRIVISTCTALSWVLISSATSGVQAVARCHDLSLHFLPNSSRLVRCVLCGHMVAVAQAAQVAYFDRPISRRPPLSAQALTVLGHGSC